MSSSLKDEKMKMYAAIYADVDEEEAEINTTKEVSANKVDKKKPEKQAISNENAKSEDEKEIVAPKAEQSSAKQKNTSKEVQERPKKSNVSQLKIENELGMLRKSKTKGGPKNIYLDPDVREFIDAVYEQSNDDEHKMSYSTIINYYLRKGINL